MTCFFLTFEAEHRFHGSPVLPIVRILGMMFQGQLRAARGKISQEDVRRQVREGRILHLGDRSVAGSEAFAAWKNQICKLLRPGTRSRRATTELYSKLCLPRHDTRSQ